MLHEIVDGERIPFGWAIAFYDPIEDLYWTAPIGIHWIVRAVRRAWEWTAAYEFSRWELEMRVRADQYVSELLKDMHEV